MPVVTFWISAFIPRTVTGYTRVLTAGPHIAKTAIPLPRIARAWPGNTFKDLDAGYLTDQRSFDPSFGASARMQSLAEVDVSSSALIKQVHRSSGTTEVNLVSGVQTGFAVADMSRCEFIEVKSPAGPPGGFGAHLAVAKGGPVYPAALPRRPEGRYGSISVKVFGAASDPLVGMAADIDYVGVFKISGGSALGSLDVSFEGLIDAFPAYDCYASFGGVTKAIFTSSPPLGKTVADLLGPASWSIGGVARFG